MKFCLLASGSKGNCIWVEEDDLAVVVDCGLSFKEFKRRADLVGLDVNKLAAVMITHEHRDHISGVGTLCRGLQIPAIANQDSMGQAAPHVGKVTWENFTTGDTLSFGSLKIRTIPISHDAKDPVAFLLGSSSGNLGLATDLGVPTGLLRQQFKGAAALILEFNHDYQLLMDGPYPWPLKQRVRSRIGHLANEVAAELAAELYHEDMKHLVLAHLSETNNHPDLALKAAREFLKGDLEPVVANQFAPSPIFEF